MRELLFTPLAQTDIGNIWDYTMHTWGADQAIVYNKSIEEAINNIANGSQVTFSADHIKGGYRKEFTGRHVIYFLSNKTTITIVRLLHQNMDVEANL